MATLKRRKHVASKHVKDKKKKPECGGRSPKQKGSKFDLGICRILTAWITGAPQPEILWRTATSGGRATMGRKVGIDVGMHGDIMSIDARSKWLTNNFFFECKSYSKIDFSLILEGKGNVIAWWNKAVTQAAQAKKWPLMIFKQNNSQTYIAGYFDMPLFKEFPMTENDAIYIKKLRSPNYIGKIVIIPLDQFLAAMAPKSLERFLSRGRRKA